MSDTNRASHVLFPAGGTEEMNIKFFRGTQQQVTPEQLRDELYRADAQVREGVAKVTNDLEADLTTFID